MMVAGGFIPRMGSRKRITTSLRDVVKYSFGPGYLCFDYRAELFVLPGVFMPPIPYQNFHLIRGINAPATILRPSGAKK